MNERPNVQEGRANQHYYMDKEPSRSSVDKDKRRAKEEGELLLRQKEAEKAREAKSRNGSIDQYKQEDYHREDRRHYGGHMEQESGLT